MKKNQKNIFELPKSLQNSIMKEAAIKANEAQRILVEKYEKLHGEAEAKNRC